MVGKNNPLNVRQSYPNNWKGSVGITKGFADFDTLHNGVRAAFYLIYISYYKKGLFSIDSIIRRYCPDGNEEPYIACVVQHMRNYLNMPSLSRFRNLYSICTCSPLLVIWYLVLSMSFFEGNPLFKLLSPGELSDLREKIFKEFPLKHAKPDC